MKKTKSIKSKKWRRRRLTGKFEKISFPTIKNIFPNLTVVLTQNVAYVSIQRTKRHISEMVKKQNMKPPTPITGLLVHDYVKGWLVFNGDEYVTIDKYLQGVNMDKSVSWGAEKQNDD